MTILPVITNPNEILRKKSIEIKKISPEIELLVEDMIESMKQEKGIGLAAPQIGKNIRLVVIEHKNEPLVLINPKICQKSFGTNKDEEGCLSVPGVFGIVRRHNKVTVKAQDKKGKEITIQGKGLLSRILQHEIDHLDGILFIDKAIKITKEKSK